MSTIKKPPLLEAIFELRWGETALGEFSYSNEDQSLFVGKISAFTESKGYPHIQVLRRSGSAMLPMMITHRFRKEEESYPCFQAGLGVFTINQIADGYSWESFKESINTGLNIYSQAKNEKLDDSQRTLNLILRYQDAFFPSEGESTQDYVAKHFNVKMHLPEDFLKTEDVGNSVDSIHIKLSIDSINPKGTIDVVVTNAIIDGKPGLLMETVVKSLARVALTDSVDLSSILTWTEQAHKLQKHSFKTLIKTSAYK